MSLNRRPAILATVKFRLTAWYLVLFALVSLGVLAVAQARLSATLRERTDEDLSEDLREFEALYSARGSAALQDDFTREANSSGPDAVFLILLSSNGEVLVSSDLVPWRGLRMPPAGLGPLRRGETGLASLVHPASKEPVRAGGIRLADGAILCIGRTLDEETELMEIFNGVLLVAILGMLVSGGVMGWLLARRAMAGVERVTKTATGIGRDRLGERVSIGHEGREIEDLAVAFNGMLQRIDELVKSLREVTDNLAHDLRSPISRLRIIAETTLTAEPGPDDPKELAATVIEEADALIALLNTMLEIAETDAGMARIGDTPVDVGELVRKAHELYFPAAEDRDLRFACDPLPPDLVVRGDLARLQRVIANILDNAVKNTPRGGTIRLSAAKTATHVAIVVADTGTGIDAKDLPRIFERFYRGDASRSQPGSGLGLSLSQAIVRAHGGRIEVRSEVGKGSVFTVLLPLPAPAPQAPRAT